MGGMTGGAVEHLLPFVEILIAVVGAVGVIIVTGWRGFKWLDEQMTGRFKTLISEFTAANDRRHLEHAQAIADLRDRDKERAAAIKRTHERIDNIMERIPPA